LGIGLLHFGDEIPDRCGNFASKAVILYKKGEQEGFPYRALDGCAGYKCLSESVPHKGSRFLVEGCGYPGGFHFIQDGLRPFRLSLRDDGGGGRPAVVSRAVILPSAYLEATKDS
jgi:hypothetical protein